MANQLTCDLCGGKIVMQTGGKAACEQCGFEYSLESLREKMGKPQQAAPQASAANATNDVVKNKLLQAQRALDTKHYWEAAKYAKEIHDIDCTHQEAWFIRVQAEALEKPQWAASALAQSRQYIEDEKMWQKILDNIRPAVKQSEFTEYNAEPAVKLLSVDLVFGKEYVEILLENAAKKIKEWADRQRKAFADHQRKRPPFTPSDNADMVSLERNFKLCLIEFQKIVQALGKMLAACEQRNLDLDDAFAKTFGQLQDFFDDAEKFKQWTSHMEISGGVNREIKYHDRLEPFINEKSREYHGLKQEYKSVIAPIEKKIQKAKQTAADQYWQANRVKKELLEKERSDAIKQIEQLQQQEKKLAYDGTGRDIARRISELQREHDRLGIFKGKQKLALQEQISKMQNQLSKWEKDHAIAQNTIRRQIGVHRANIERIFKILQNPEI